MLRNGLISYEMFTTETIQGRICYAIHYSQALKRLRSLPSCAASCIYALIRLSPEERELINRIYFSGLFASSAISGNGYSLHDDTAPQSKNSCKAEKTYGKLKIFFVQLRSELAYKGVRNFFLPEQKFLTVQNYRGVF